MNMNRTIETKNKINSLISNFENTRQTIINSLSDGEYTLDNVFIDGMHVTSMKNGVLYHDEYEYDPIDLLSMDDLYCILDGIKIK